jgi:putative two-component system response regulator
MANLSIAKNMLKTSYRVSTVPSAEQLFNLLADLTPDIILLDVEMPVMDGYHTMKKLKSVSDWAEIPVIFLTAQADESSEMTGLSLGAVDYVLKPFSAPLLLKRIENHLFIDEQKKKLKAANYELTESLNRKTQQIARMQGAVISMVADLVEFKDDVTGGHVARTQGYLEVLLDQMQRDGVYSAEMSDWDRDFLLPSAQLHDVGKIAISDTILNKPGKLTPEEFEIMKTHTTIGVNAIRRIEKRLEEHAFLIHARLFAGGHHERWDGTGYPAGLKGTDIPLEGRIMAIADVYDALISKRPYKNSFSVEEANRIILEGTGTHFDPALAQVFSKVAGQFADIVKKNLGHA